MIAFWLCITVVAVILEVITVDLVSIWFAIGGAVALIVCLLNAALIVQISLFVVVSLISIIIVRPLAKKYMRTNVVSTNSDRVIGQHGLVTKRIDADSKGEVKVLSTDWLASSVDNSVLEKDDYCEILAIEGAHLVVRKINKGE